MGDRDVNTDIAQQIICESTRETLMRAEEDLQQAEKNLRYAEDELRDAGREITLPRPQSGRRLKALRLSIDAAIEERKSWAR
jgi:hypothetical protein